MKKYENNTETFDNLWLWMIRPSLYSSLRESYAHTRYSFIDCELWELLSRYHAKCSSEYSTLL